jgi:transposase-like protein
VIDPLPWATVFDYDRQICPIFKNYQRAERRRYSRSACESLEIKISQYILEQDHRLLKGKLPYRNNFQSTYTAAAAIKRIEAVSALYKESRREIILFGFSAWDEIKMLFKPA